MDKICFCTTHIDGIEVLVAAHTRDYAQKGSYIARNLSQFEKLETPEKIECINDMIVALINHVEVKDNIQFSDYQRQ